MAIVYRNGRTYAYKSVREGAKVKTTYRASGELAELFGEFDEVMRRKKYVIKANEINEREILEEMEEPLIQYDDFVEDLARAALFASGYHLHKRQWRKRRERSQES